MMDIGYSLLWLLMVRDIGGQISLNYIKQVVESTLYTYKYTHMCTLHR